MSFNGNLFGTISDATIWLGSTGAVACYMLALALATNSCDDPIEPGPRRKRTLLGFLIGAPMGILLAVSGAFEGASIINLFGLPFVLFFSLFTPDAFFILPLIGGAGYTLLKGGERSPGNIMWQPVNLLSWSAVACCGSTAVSLIFVGI